jgi:hypothetical protein
VKRELSIVALVSFSTICLADDGQTPVSSAAAVATAAIASQRAARPRQVAMGANATPIGVPSAAPDSTTSTSAPPATATAGSTSGPTATSTSGNATNGALVATGITGTAANGSPGIPDPQFASEAKWVLAGYNSDEIVYTVFVTNQDPRIIRCTTEVKGFYFENGTKLSIQDRQITTVFPNQPTRVGYWMDMDQQSGATYSVKCHPV